MMNKIIKSLSILLFLSLTYCIVNVLGTTELENYVIVNDNTENKYTTFELAVESIDSVLENNSDSSMSLEDTIKYTVVGKVDFNIKNNIDISRGRDNVVINGENGTLNILGPVLTYLNFEDSVAEINKIEFIDSRDAGADWEQFYLRIVSNNLTLNNCTFSNEGLLLSKNPCVKLNGCKFVSEISNHYGLWIGDGGSSSFPTYSDNVGDVDVINCEFTGYRGIKVMSLAADILIDSCKFEVSVKPGMCFDSTKTNANNTIVLDNNTFINCKSIENDAKSQWSLKGDTKVFDILDSDIKLNLNETYEINYILNSDFVNDCVWSSDNTDVVTINEEGVLTALSEGQAVITCSPDIIVGLDSKNIGTCSVSVNVEVPKLDTVYLDFNSITDGTGEKLNPVNNLESAAKFVADDGEIILLNDYTATTSLGFNNLNLNINMNGKTLNISTKQWIGGNVTLSNGYIDFSNINGTDGISIGNTGVLTLENMSVSAKDYKTSYCVFYVYGNLNISNSNLNFENDLNTSGGVIKADHLTPKINITNNSIIKCTNTSRGLVKANIYIKDSEIFMDKNYNCINSSILEVVDSNITLTNSTSRGLSLATNNFTIRGNSEITLDETNAYGIRFENTGIMDMYDNTVLRVADVRIDLANKSIYDLVKLNDSAKLIIIGAVAEVTPRQYKTLNEAIDALDALQSDTIELIDNVDVSNVIIPESTDVKLKLNKFTMNLENPINLSNAVKLSIENGAINGEGILIKSEEMADIILSDVEMKGEEAVTLNAGTITLLNDIDIDSNRAFNLGGSENSVVSLNIDKSMSGDIKGDVRIDKYESCDLKILGNLNHNGTFSLNENSTNNIEIKNGCYSSDISQYLKDGYLLKDNEHEVYIYKVTSSAKISFNGNGSSTTVSDIEIIKGSNFELPENMFEVPKGYKFDCWKINGVSYEVGEVITIEEDLEIEAVWDRIKKKSSSSSAAKKYAAIITETENGIVNTEPSKAKYKEIVKINIKPIEGKEVEEILVKTKDNELIKVTDMTYVQPDEQVTIEIVYKDKQIICDGLVETCPCLTFEDLDTSKWYHLSVDYVIGNELILGYPNNLFEPEKYITRAQLITILWRLENKPTADVVINFNDVDLESYYINAVRWGKSVGIINGYNDKEFKPNAVIKREEMISIMWRYANYKKYDVSVHDDNNSIYYKDISEVSDWALVAMKWACESGMINGIDGNLMPSGQTTRAQGAAILQRFCINICSK